MDLDKNQQKSDKLFLEQLEKHPLEIEKICRNLRYEVRDLIPLGESQLKSLSFPSRSSQQSFALEEKKRTKKVQEVLSLLNSRNQTFITLQTEIPRTETPIFSSTMVCTPEKQIRSVRTQENFQKIKLQRESWAEQQKQLSLEKGQLAQKRKRRIIARQGKPNNKYHEKVLQNKLKIQEQNEKNAQLTEEIINRKMLRTAEKQQKRPKTFGRTAPTDETRYLELLELINKKTYDKTLLRDEQVLLKAECARKHSQLVINKNKEKIQRETIAQEEALSKNIQKALLLKKKRKNKEKIHKSFSIGNQKKKEKAKEKFEKRIKIKEIKETEWALEVEKRLEKKAGVSKQASARSQAILLDKIHRNFEKRLKCSRNYSLELTKQMKFKQNIIDKHRKTSERLEDWTRNNMSSRKTFFDFSPGILSP